VSTREGKEKEPGKRARGGLDTPELTKSAFGVSGLLRGNCRSSGAVRREKKRDEREGGGGFIDALGVGEGLGL
jgi:hypothetical protein